MVMQEVIRINCLIVYVDAFADAWFIHKSASSIAILLNKRVIIKDKGNDAGGVYSVKQ